MRFFIKNFGCASNRADGEAIRETLLGSGFEESASPDSAEAVIVNTCTVRGETELKVLKYLRSVAGRRVIVTGCMAAVQPALIAKHAPFASVVSPNNMAKLPRVMENQSRSLMLGGDETPPDPAPFATGLRYTIAISRGCRGSCSYCIVRFARGRLRSLGPEKICSMISQAVKLGAKEIQLTSQDTGAYGSDIGTDLPVLLQRLVSIVGDFRLRVGMFNPSSVAPLIGRLSASFSSEKIFKFAHIPLQSGSDRILREMNRCYTADSFRGIVNSMRSAFPDMTLATDIIVGYPGETDDDFEATRDLLSELGPNKIHIARYSQRPHTAAASLRQVPEAVKKRRSENLAILKREIQLTGNQRWIGQSVDATALEVAKGGMLARTDEYRPVLISRCDPSLLGRRVSLIIDSCTPFRLLGRINRR